MYQCFVRFSLWLNGMRKRYCYLLDTLRLWYYRCSYSTNTRHDERLMFTMSSIVEDLRFQEQLLTYIYKLPRFVVGSVALREEFSDFSAEYVDRQRDLLHRKKFVSFDGFTVDDKWECEIKLTARGCEMAEEILLREYQSATNVD